MCRPDGRHVLNNQGTDDYVLTKFLPSGNLRKLACKGHIPLAPYALQKSVITPPGFLIFYAYKNTPPETAYQKFSI